MTADLPVLVECRPVVVYEWAGALVGWCLWVVRATYADGRVTTEYRYAEAP